jgi:hypothetical protein
MAQIQQLTAVQRLEIQYAQGMHSRYPLSALTVMRSLHQLPCPTSVTSAPSALFDSLVPAPQADGLGEFSLSGPGSSSRLAAHSTQDVVLWYAILGTAMHAPGISSGSGCTASSRGKQVVLQGTRNNCSIQYWLARVVTSVAIVKLSLNITMQLMAATFWIAAAASSVACRLEFLILHVPGWHVRHHKVWTQRLRSFQQIPSGGCSHINDITRSSLTYSVLHLVAALQFW